MKTQASLTLEAPTRLALWGEAARYAVLLMELLWIANWYDLLIQPPISGLTLLLYLGVIMLFSHLLARGMNYRNIRAGWRRAVFAAWIILAVLLSLQGLVYGGMHLTLGELVRLPLQSIVSLQDDLRAFWNILLVLLLAARSVALAREPVGILAAQFSFQLGLIMMLFYGIGMGFVKPLQAVLSLYAFLFCGLVAMSAARIYSVGDLRGGKLPLPGRKWALGIFLSALVIVGSGVFAGWASSTWAAAVVLQGYLLLFALLVVAALIVLSPLIALLFLVLPGLRDLLTDFFRDSALSEFMKFISNVAENTREPPEWVVTGLQVGKPLFFGGILLVVAVALLFFLVWKPWQQQAGREDETSDLPFRPLLGLPRLVLNRLGGSLSHRRRLLAAARVRRVYAQLMALAAALGKPRPQAVTPVEFLPRLVEQFPRQKDGLDLITQAYLQVRYGMMPETLGEVQRVEAAWEQIKKEGQPRAAELKRSLKRAEKEP